MKIVNKNNVVAPAFECSNDQPAFGGFHPSKGKQFLSTVQTGTGASQSIAHGLGATPSAVVVVPQDNTATSIVEGAHDATNVKVTVTTGSHFKVMAYL